MSRRLAPVSRRIPATSFAEMLRHLGDGHFEAGRFKLARRHYRAALRVEPQNALAWARLGRAWEEDPNGSDDRAFRCFRRAAAFESVEPLYHAHLGRCAVRLRRNDVAKSAIAEAVKLAPAEAAVLAVVVEAFREAGKVEKAWKLVCRARFLAPADKTIRDLWNRIRYDLAASGPKTLDDTGERTVLPFLRIVREDGQSTWRLDAPSRLKMHAEL